MSEDGTSVTGRFRISRDAAESAVWPGDLELALTLSLGEDALRIESEVRNLADRPVPFGLGFHPYFAPLDLGSGADAAAKAGVYCDVTQYWVLNESIPTGTRLPVSGELGLRRGPPVGTRNLDDVLTGLPEFVAGEDGLMARVAVIGNNYRLELRCDENWRDIVVFTPSNRECIAIEPYT